MLQNEKTFKKPLAKSFEMWYNCLAVENTAKIHKKRGKQNERLQF